ncbi:MAG: Grx4 family monothiol glutaredoxin [Candidatus Melainabacteria bacterium]|nr:Grx4 family monothiol glutaredoxin [Candidatus Melainabacteria bacterium]MBI3309360.1 Grx4 family monothiol glutaredoxin [Candidatus Melainabacteria bacterium]
MTEILQRIDKEVKEHKIIVYMKGTKEEPQCGFSAAVVDIFKILQVPFETRNVLEDMGLREGVKKYSHWSTIPQVFISGQFVGGCDITRELFQSGELQKLVNEAIAKK